MPVVLVDKDIVCSARLRQFTRRGSGTACVDSLRWFSRGARVGGAKAKLCIWAVWGSNGRPLGSEGMLWGGERAVGVVAVKVVAQASSVSSLGRRLQSSVVSLQSKRQPRGCAGCACPVRTRPIRCGERRRPVQQHVRVSERREKQSLEIPEGGARARGCEAAMYKVGAVRRFFGGLGNSAAPGDGLACTVDQDASRLAEAMRGDVSWDRRLALWLPRWWREGTLLLSGSEGGSGVKGRGRAAREGGPAVLGSGLWCRGPVGAWVRGGWQRAETAVGRCGGNASRRVVESLRDTRAGPRRLTCTLCC